MSFYCHQVSYTKEAWSRLIQNPQDRLEAVRAPIEKLGGKMHTSYFAFRPFDVLAITEFPDEISAAAISMAFAARGAVSHIQTTPLLTAAEALEALRKAKRLRLSIDLQLTLLLSQVASSMFGQARDFARSDELPKAKFCACFRRKQVPGISQTEPACLKDRERNRERTRDIPPIDNPFLVEK